MQKNPAPYQIAQMNHEGAQNELNAPLWGGGYVGQGYVDNHS